MKYRHEFKYFISAGEIEILKPRIAAVAPLDAHVGERGRYTIRSLYFDNYADRCYYENESGTDPREKFRIRIYNASAARIRLECKRKERGKTLKTSCAISEEQCRLLMRGEIPLDVGEEQTVLRKIAQLMATERFEPKIIVEYERVPYVYPVGNVRITFDTEIRSSPQISAFLDKNPATRPILRTGQHILEVKYDELLPDFIRNVLELGTLRQTAFSKYYLCRKYTIGGRS